MSSSFRIGWGRFGSRAAGEDFGLLEARPGGQRSRPAGWGRAGSRAAGEDLGSLGVALSGGRRSGRGSHEG